MAKTSKANPHAGSSFDDLLKEDGIFEEVQARALKRALAEQLDEAMQSGKLSKVNMAQRMSTSRVAPNWTGCWTQPTCPSSLIR